MEWYIEINSEFSEIDRAEAELSVFLSGIYKGDNRRLLFILTLTFRELLLNAVEHGNKMDKGKTVGCYVECQNKRVTFDIYDKGNGFVLLADGGNIGRERQRGIDILQKMGFRIRVDGNHVQAIFDINYRIRRLIIWKKLLKIIKLSLNLKVI